MYGLWLEQKINLYNHTQEEGAGLATFTQLVQGVLPGDIFNQSSEDWKWNKNYLKIKF